MTREEKGEPMDDLISRQAAIDALESGKDKRAKGNIGGFYNAIIQNDIERLRNLSSAQRWIPCTERLPEEDKEVLVYLWGDCPYLAWVNNDGQWETNDIILDKKDLPTEWMPLPEPLKRDLSEI